MFTNKKLGGVLSRFLSYIIDGLILGVLGTIVSTLVQHPLIFSSFNRYMWPNFEPTAFLGLIYFTYFFGVGATPGMNVLDLKLIKEDGGSPSYLTGLIRYIGMIISSIFFFLGFIWILIDSKNQGWHDKMSQTLVINDEN
ncbi:RDD family protein [archaeon SCG-AAA382B04]|nr:RDD family protein [archaeon SCG-AAA382B04]